MATAWALLAAGGWASSAEATADVIAETPADVTAEAAAELTAEAAAELTAEAAAESPAETAGDAVNGSALSPAEHGAGEVPASEGCEGEGEGGVSSGWIVNESDNVCGVRPARQVTNPASVRYDELLESTPEIQRMKRESIQRDSAQGQVLYAAAVDRVSKAAKRVMGAQAYCSVWKQIRHSDGRQVPDISIEVKAEL
jgi:hypothetical protein